MVVDGVVLDAPSVNIASTNRAKSFGVFHPKVRAAMPADNLRSKEKPFRYKTTSRLDKMVAGQKSLLPSPTYTTNASVGQLSMRRRTTSPLHNLGSQV